MVSLIIPKGSQETGDNCAIMSLLVYILIKNKQVWYKPNVKMVKIDEQNILFFFY